MFMHMLAGNVYRDGLYGTWEFSGRFDMYLCIYTHIYIHTRVRQEMFIVMDYMERGSLAEVLIDKETELTWQIRRQMALDAARGMR